MAATIHARTLTEPAPTLTHARRASPATATVEDAGSLFGLLVPWDTPATVSDNGRATYTEQFAPGGLTAPTGSTVPVYAGHVYGPTGRLERGPLVGRVDDLEARADGLYGRVTLADVAAATELRALARTVGATFSVEFADDAAPAGGRVIRTGAVMTGLAVMTAPHRGSYPGAEVLSVRAAPDEGPDDDDEDGPEGAEDGDAEAEGGPAPTGPPASARASIEREVRRILGRGTGRPPAAHPLARFPSAYEFHAAARLSADDELPRLFAAAYHEHRARAWVDQITPDNPGVMPPGWLNEIFGIIDMGRPVINAIGTRPLPPSGMEIDWPYFDGDLHALVGAQAVEKTDITSVKVALKKAAKAITTYAGGSDLSWQLIRRSAPSYRDAYLRILQAAYGVVTDQAATTQVVAGAGVTQPVDLTTDENGAILRGAVFAASAKVQTATGTPAQFVLASPNVFVGFASLPTMMPTQYGTQNVTGTAQANTLDVNVSGLPVILAPDMAASTAIVSNRLACAWMEDGPFVVAAPDIPKLGEDVAIWGMGAFAPFLAQGIIKLTPTLPPPLFADDEGASSSRAKK